MRTLVRTYADWYFNNFSKFHLDSKLFGLNFNLCKAGEFLLNFSNIAWSDFSTDEEVFKLWINQLSLHLINIYPYVDFTKFVDITTP